MKTDDLSPGSAFDFATTAPRPAQDERTHQPLCPGARGDHSSILGHPGTHWRDKLRGLLAEAEADLTHTYDPFPEASAQRRRLRDQLLAAVRVRAREEAKEDRRLMDAAAAVSSAAAKLHTEVVASAAEQKEGEKAAAKRRADAAVEAAVVAAAAAAEARLRREAAEDAAALTAKRYANLQPLPDQDLRARIASLSPAELTARLKAQAAARNARRRQKVEARKARGAARHARAREREVFGPVSKKVRAATRAIKEAVHGMVAARRYWRKAKRVSAAQARKAAADAVKEAKLALQEAQALKAAADARAGVTTDLGALLPKVAADGPLQDAAWLEQQRAEFLELNAARMEKERKAALVGLGKQDKERHVKVVIRKLRGRLAQAQRMRLALARSRLKAAEKEGSTVTEEAKAILVAAVERAEVAARDIPEDMLLNTLADAEKEVRALVAQAGGAVKPAAPPVSLATENSGFSKARRRKAPRDPHARRAARAGMPKGPRIPRGQKEAEQVATPKDLREPPITAAAAGLLDDLLK